jgi:hypothetical protein
LHVLSIVLFMAKGIIVWLLVIAKELQELFSAIAASRDGEPVGCGVRKRADKATGDSGSV